MRKDSWIKSLKQFNKDGNIIRYSDNVIDLKRIQDKEYIKLLQLYLKTHKELDKEDKYLFRNFMKLYQTIALMVED